MNCGKNKVAEETMYNTPKVQIMDWNSDTDELNSQ